MLKRFYGGAVDNRGYKVNSCIDSAEISEFILPEVNLTELVNRNFATKGVPAVFIRYKGSNNPTEVVGYSVACKNRQNLGIIRCEDYFLRGSFEFCADKVLGAVNYIIEFLKSIAI